MTTFEQDFDVKDYLGKGEYGKVHKIYSKSEHFSNDQSETKFAVKIYSKEALLAKRKDISYIVKEIKTLRKLNTPDNHFSISLKYLYEDTQNLYLITDLLEGKTLSEFFRSNLKSFSEYNCMKIVAQ